VLVIRSVEPAQAVPLFWEVPLSAGVTGRRWKAYCKRRGLVALAAEQEGDLVGFAVAESRPNLVHVLSLEGYPDTCRRLLGRLVRLAGERDVSASCLSSRPALLAVLEEKGFVRVGQDSFLGRTLCRYYWRNE